MRKISIAAVLALVTALVVLMTVPALAHHKDGHEGGTATATGTGGTEYDNSTEPCPDANGDDDNRHPSGKDRSCESGGSGAQGRSGSAPDEDGHGPERDYEGTDKPGGPGGMDKDDQDGNNGCGNDDDFEDDNEGWCGKPPAPPEVDDTDTDTDDDTDDDDTDVGGEVIPTFPDVDGEVEGDVLGSRINQARPGTIKAPAVGASPARAKGSSLPFTGAALAGYLLTALGLIGSGYLVVRSRRS